MKVRKCPKCKNVLNIDNFTKDRSNVNGVATYCKTCTSIRHKKHRDLNPEKYKSTIIKTRRYANIQEQRRDYSLRSKYGICIEDFEKMLLNQSYKCKICDFEFNNRKKIFVDHCHKSSKVRGLLCYNCNIALGHIKDNIYTLKNMINYLSL